ncbi:MAG: cyclic nucleotide-binding domain-containing protein [Burkholderiales bacterium]|nr:cyclic nucleotide-binding domain-containing protein [Burkholderiales bacterium]
MIEQILDYAKTAVVAALSSPIEIAALIAVALAAGLTVTSSFVKTMVPLRWLAVGSNCGFFAYGALHGAPVLAILHAVLLPINVARLLEMRRLTENVTTAAASKDTSGIWLTPYMKATKRKKGYVLFKKGDVARHLYLLASGRVEFVEIGRSVGPGMVFGEIAFFAPDGRRTLTARCAEDCKVLSVNQNTVRQIYYQNPGFGFELIGLVAGRLSADVVRLEEQLAQAKAAAPAAEA